MSDLLARGAQVLTAKQKAGSSRTVVYSHGGLNVTVQATIGQTPFQIDDGQGGVITFQTRDFLIPAADLVLGGLAVEPARGDTIAETDTGRVYTYEVLLAGTEPVAGYSGPCRDRWRIHTKLRTAA